MKFVTSAYLEVAVKLLSSATVKGFFFVEERAERGEIEKIRSRIREKQIKKIFLLYLIALSYFMAFLYLMALFLTWNSGPKSD